MMQRFYEALIFRRGEKLLYRVDPRAKVIILISYVIFAALTYDLVYMCIGFIALLITSYLCAEFNRVSQSLIASSRLFIILFIVLYIFIAYPNFLSAKAAIYTLTAILRLAVLILAFSIFFSTTHPDDLAQALVKLRVPFDLAYTLVLSIRFVPTIIRDIQIVYDAQRSRGLEVEKGNMFERLKKLIPLLIPAFILTLMRVDRVAEAMESRAFGAVKNRTFLHELKLTPHDVLVSIALSVPAILITLLAQTITISIESLIVGV